MERSNISLIIDGRAADSSRRVEVLNPADTRDVVGSIPDASPDDVDRAVRSANDAFADWSSRPVAERVAAVRAVGQRIASITEPMVELLARENGKVRAECHIDLDVASKFAGYLASITEESLQPVTIKDPGGTTVIRRRSVGPVAIVTPWNFPVVLSFINIAPALLAGNTVVVKPSVFSPLTLSEVIAAIQEDLPPGVLNLVTGGDDTGAALVEHPLIRKVAFTGGIETGRKVMASAAQDIKRVTLELAGNDPAILLDDVSLTDEVIGGLVKGTYATAGQVCFGVKRIYVPEALHDDFVRRFTAAVDGIMVGPSSDPRSTMGPLINEEQKRSVEKLVEEAAAGGATVTELGTKLDTAAWDHGHFMLPSVVTGVAPDAPIVAAEQFGPTVPVIPYREVDDVVRMANDSRYGLCSSIWTADEERGFALAERIEAGSTFINSHGFTSLDPRAPFGGVKSSGLGREMGPGGVQAFTELQTVSRRFGPPGGGGPPGSGPGSAAGPS